MRIGRNLRIAAPTIPRAASIPLIHHRRSAAQTRIGKIPGFFAVADPGLATAGGRIWLRTIGQHIQPKTEIFNKKIEA